MQNLYKLMGEQHLLMSFVSDFSREKFESILSLVKESVNKPNISFLNQKRIYALAVESLDNVLKYINSVDQKNLPLYFKSKLFVISEKNNHYLIRTGSFVLDSQKVVLQNQIEKVNALGKPQLRKFYLETILNSKPEGGGLGLIEMALKTNNKITYNFYPETENISLFAIETKLLK